MLSRLKNYFTRGELNVVLFKILGVGGVGVSICTSLFNFLTQDYKPAVIDGSAAILAILLLYYVEHTGHYLIGYIITEISVFMILFTMLYFSSRGIDGTIPYFFSFGLMFTFLMFRGKLLVLMETIMSAYYMTVLLISIKYPELSSSSGSTVNARTERIAGIFIPALAMGLIFLLYIKEYENQKRIAEEANHAKSIFLANMSHEIRTPINAVLGFNEMILRTSTDNNAKEYAGYIDQSGHRLLRVVNEILDFSKVESGKSELTLESFRLSELAEEMKSMMSIMAKNKSLDYVLDYDEQLHDMVRGDREKLVRILTNLLSNAFKYTKEGSVTLHIQLKEETAKGQKVYFAVEDTGIGIRMADIDNLFHAYERADLMKNREIEGTGLGLAITEQLLHLLGSSVHVESTYGKGSIFSFEISTQTLETEEQQAQNAKSQRTFAAPEAHVLVVDDDEMNRRMMDSFLNMFRLQADFAENGEVCLSKVKTQEYDLILMDYMMPGMDGAAAMEKIRDQEAGTGRHTPIVVLTADVVDHTDRKLMERGFDDYLSKPVELRVLEETMLRYIPEDKIIWEETEEHSSIPREQYEACEELLLGSGIYFKEGMRLVNGDFTQYLHIISFFVNSAPADFEKVQSAAETEDIQNLRLCMHALKGKAGSIGAKDLQAYAATVESRCREADMEYVLCSLDLLYLQWRRCVEGLKRLLDTETGKPSAYEPAASALKGYTFADLTEELCRNLSLYEGKKAKKLVEQMKETGEGGNYRQVLEEILELIEAMEFETALEKAKQNLTGKQ